MKNDTQEQYLMELSRQCYSLLQEQITRRNTVIGFWTTITVVIYTVIFTANPSLILINFLLTSFFVAGFLYCNVIFGLISWQNTYKNSCDVIGKILMNKEKYNDTESISSFVKDYFKPANKKRKTKNEISVFLKSTSNRVLIYCFIISTLPFILLFIMNELWNNTISLLISVFLFFAYGIIYFIWSLSTLKRNKNKVPWLLEFDIPQINMN